jgi:dipeptidyl aminopeptidase/acylaminoacyl peptidase
VIGVALALNVSTTGTQTPAPAPTQAPPPTEIYLAPLVEGEGSTKRVLFLVFDSTGVAVRDPINITNNPGYDNQPFFLPDSSALLFSSNRDGRQTDIYKYEIATRKTTRLTETPENEYSPTITPDGRTFTTVRGVEQRLWRFNADGTDAGLAYAHKGLIGYHAWISPTALGTFILGADGAPSTLQLIDLAAGTADVIASNVGRSLHAPPGRATLSFVDKSDKDVWAIKELDPATRKITTVTIALEESEDMAWTPKGSIVMGAGSKLYVWIKREGDRWIQLGDLKKFGITAITRVAVSPDGKWVAIVSTPAVKK